MPTRGPRAAPCPPQLSAVQPRSPRPACRSCSPCGLSPTAWSALPRPRRPPPLPARAATVFLAQPSRHRAGTAPRCNLSPSSLGDLLRLPRPPCPSPLLLPPPHPAEKGHKSSPFPPSPHPSAAVPAPPRSPRAPYTTCTSPRAAAACFPRHQRIRLGRRRRFHAAASARAQRSRISAGQRAGRGRGRRGVSEGQRGRARAPLRHHRDWPVRREG